MNRLILCNSFSLFWGTNSVPVRTHKHPSIQFVICTAQPFRSKNADGIWELKQGLLISPNVTHECNAQNIEIISVDIDAESSLGEWVEKQYLSEDKILEYPSAILPEVPGGRWTDLIAESKWQDLMDDVYLYFNFQPKENLKEMDDRILKVISHIKENIHSEITTSELAERAHLSESRLLHLFKDTMGLPIRNYLLWQRLKMAFSAVIAGQSLTNAAYCAGFFDQAHMTRTFVKMIGVAPSTLLKNSKFVQVSFCE